MTIFRNNTHKEIWIMHNCHRCWQPDEVARREHGKDSMCPILKRALTPGRKTLPKEWENTRADEMERTIKCNSYTSRPSRYVNQDKQFEDVEMFSVEPQELRLVPVENWPEKPTKGGVDHQ